MNEGSIKLWDTNVQLNKEELRLQEGYAREIVKSLVRRRGVLSPQDMTILLNQASDCGYQVFLEATQAKFTLNH